MFLPRQPESRTFHASEFSRDPRVLFIDRHLPDMAEQAGVLLDQRGHRTNGTSAR